MSKLYKITRSISPVTWLTLLLLISFFFRLFRLNTPPIYIFDEVYHVVTIKAYAHNNPVGYEWWHQDPEPNTAYDWLHPPLAKLIQAGSVRLFGETSFAWRFPSVIFGTISIAALYYLALTLFKNHRLALLAAALFSLDGLQLTMSRITMNDIFVTTFIIFTLAFFYRFLAAITKKNQKLFLFLTSLFAGLSLATKHSALLVFPVLAIFTLRKFIISKAFKLKHLLIAAYCFLVIPLVVYFFSYTQFFLQGHTLKTFYELHQQIYWYQTGLTATHDYQSAAWQWPLLIRPVWFHVEYLSSSIANIYNLGNPVIFWGGLLAVVYTFFQPLNLTIIYLLAGYLFLFVPWLFSPRILFLHHYLPALPFLCLIIAKALFDFNHKLLTTVYLLLATLTFLFFYPLNTAIPIPETWLQYWFWLPTWR